MGVTTSVACWTTSVARPGRCGPPVHGVGLRGDSRVSASALGRLFGVFVSDLLRGEAATPARFGGGRVALLAGVRFGVFGGCVERVLLVLVVERSATGSALRNVVHGSSSGSPGDRLSARVPGLRR
ncbi:hypothetical protein KCH_13320 [Kitasatospora cheerisanensis KCTC 2395]|uniref:Uncharacterized protein n=1 Tax=Kitasatospora cheerisanensis KCTC 2395 TaxID=1348663 RepID=A0A066Z984_9ACTN|nr:hypothetical protein KCH_13320 [Kitasatospora cheerisanensis KCTC 2395]